MDYRESLNYIHKTPKFARVLGNDMLKKLLFHLGDPQKNLKFIHIAGTNGKGSYAVMMAEILKNSGYRVGLYTSPYIERFNERIQINGGQISDEALAEAATLVKQVIETNDAPVSEFALDTAIAFYYFNKHNCDIIVLETGLGGRIDATNVIDTAVLSVIMSIGYDHTQYLGNTIEEITYEKCGIIKPNGNVI
ncbi:MAG: bifunctional folylpolyglutamate synthase/dihydrofolate synthase, partial [Monoglobaceae bacterium]